MPTLWISSLPSPQFNCSGNARSLIAAIIFFSTLGCNDADMLGALNVPPVDIPSDELNLGKLWRGAQSTHVLHLRNTTANAITIDSFKRSCGCLSFQPDRLTITAGGESEVRVTVNLPADSMKDTPSTFSQKFIPICGGNSGVMQPFTLTGNADSLLHLSHKSVTLNEIDGAGMQGSIAIESHSAVESISVPDDRLPFAVRVEKNADSLFNLFINAKNDEVLSTQIWSELSLICELNTGESVICRGPTIYGRTKGRIAASPEIINFGFVEVGEAEMRQLSLRSLEDGAVIFIKSCVASSADLNANWSESQGELVDIVASVTASSEGAQQAELQILLQSADTQQMKAVIPVRFFGVLSTAHSSRLNP